MSFRNGRAAVVGIRRSRAWQTAIALVGEIYRLTKRFPREELFLLTSQLRRAALSIPSNLAEGNERESVRDRRHIITMAIGSLAELDTQLEVAIVLDYVDEDDLFDIYARIDDLARMLPAMRRNVRARGGSTSDRDEQ